MYSKFPGLDSHMNEEKVSNIENSITSSLISNSEKPRWKLNPCYIIVFIFIGVSAAVITYACIKLFT
jgi:hypothetical protein